MTLFYALASRPRRGWEWFKARAHGTHARAWLAFLSFSESSFLFIPPDFLLIAILLAGSQRWLGYALLTTLASIAGALFGYVIGAFFFASVGQELINLYGLSEEFARVGALFSTNTFWVMFTAAFTPIPYKVFVLAAGFFRINIWIFLIASIVGRAMRYTLIAYITHRFGEHAARLVLVHANRATVIVLALAALAALVWYGLS